MFNNITEPNQIVVIDSINHFNQGDICDDVSGYKDLIWPEHFNPSLVAVIKSF